VVRTGNRQACRGEHRSGASRLVERGRVDHLSVDFLAEITTGVLGKARRRRREAGHATDSVAIIEWLRPARKEQGTGPVANAGGVNPTGCAQVCEAVGRELGLRGVRIGVVDGDDTLGRVGELSVDGQLAHLDTGEPLGGHLDAMRAANAYLGRPRSSQCSVTVPSSPAGWPTPPSPSARCSTSSDERSTTWTAWPPGSSPATSSSGAPRSGGDFDRWRAVGQPEASEGNGGRPAVVRASEPLSCPGLTVARRTGAPQQRSATWSRWATRREASKQELSATGRSWIGGDGWEHHRRRGCLMVWVGHV